ncbi:DUF1963 domain-containing protein [Streptomyces niveus]|uniref:DUF1963 domain-containing protein n=1 Tax=Streptomyces niveus TaxID=193462 RepID=UPI00365B2D90
MAGAMLARMKENSFDASLLDPFVQVLPAELRQRWLDLVRPAVRFRMREDGDGPAVWRYGGEPNLPDEMPWPVKEGEGPLNYMGALDCAGIPRHELDIPLPADGTLLFFLHDNYADWDSLDRARVVYVPASAATSPRQLPEETVGGDNFYDGEDFLVVDRAVPTMPDTDTYMIDALGIPQNAKDALGGLQWDLDGEVGDWLYQIGGHPTWIQNPHVESEGFIGTGNEKEDLAYLERDWLLLAMTPGSGDGTFYWFMRSADLADGRFDRAVLNFQC